MHTARIKSDIEELLESQTWKTRKNLLNSNENLIKIRRKTLNPYSGNKPSKKIYDKDSKHSKTLKTIQNDEKLQNFDKNFPSYSENLKNQVSDFSETNSCTKSVSYQYQIPVFPMINFGNSKRNDHINPQFKLVSNEVDKEVVKEVKIIAGRVKKGFRIRNEKFLFLNDFIRLREQGMFNRREVILGV